MLPIQLYSSKSPSFQALNIVLTWALVIVSPVPEDKLLSESVPIGSSYPNAKLSSNPLFQLANPVTSIFAVLVPPAVAPIEIAVDVFGVNLDVNLKSFTKFDVASSSVVLNPNKFIFVTVSFLNWGKTESKPGIGF